MNYVEREVEGLQDIYRLIAQLTSMEDCFVLFQHLKGLTINFPTKLLDPTYVKKYLRREFQKNQPITKKMIQQWALSFDYSERQIRRLLKEIKEEIKKEEIQPLPYVSNWLNQQSMEGKKDGKDK